MRRPLAPLLLAALLGLGAGPGVWHYPGAGERSPGTLKDVSLAAGGVVLLAPRSEEILPGEHPYSTPPLLLAVQADPGGTTWVGGGLGAQVLRIDAKGKVNTVFESSGVGVRALASDLAGDLLVATVPEGRIYRVSEEGDTDVFFEPEERYIWAMTTDAFDRVYVATGERGIVYAVAGPGEASVYFDSDEPHITSLAMDPSGRLLAGSSGHGRLFRVESDGKGQVVLDSGLEEISSIVVASDGTIYAAAIRGRGPEPPKRPTDGSSDITVEVSGEPDDEVLEETAEPPRKVVLDLSELVTSGQEEKAKAPMSRLYRISPDRTAEAIWSSATEWVYAVALDSRGHLLAGTGPDGRLYRIEPDGSATMVRQYPASQITALASGAKGATYVLTSNPGRLYRLDASASDSGEFLSPVHDAGTIASWGRLSWEADLPKGTRLSFVARSGNTPVPDETWSGWSDEMTEPEKGSLSAPAGRYVQWRASLSRLKTEATPVLTETSLSFLPQNLPPTVADVLVSAPGRKPPASGSEAGHEPEGDRKSQDSSRWLWISWQSSDPDGDPLRHSVSIRREGDSDWLSLAENVTEHKLALDPEGHPDGRYVARVEANDSQVNGVERALQASARSRPFVVDNTPPVIDAGEPKMAEKTLTLEFQGTDALSPLARAEWAARPEGPWTLVLPRDGITDSRSESFRLTLKLEGLDRELLLRLTDASENTTTRKISLPRWQ
ncbi:MAG TPA: hypothetical protein VNI57_03510 [Candidatus Saccharimonadales bacterium]|nr:hypothetical protein [Candidatus Saccharimonadales bacterium]